MAKSRPYVRTSEVLGELQAFVSPGKIVLQGGFEPLDLPHLLSARQLSGQGEESLERFSGSTGPTASTPTESPGSPEAGGNTRRAAREHLHMAGIHLLLDVPLVLESIGKAIEKHDPRLLIITGIPSLFYHSDIPRNEAERALDPLLEALPGLA
ncbi:hypothetical protein AKJ64_04235 [candidate division MSBL1 archaeon SCGC-AAA259E17]|uniref:Uncharacterized protein n=1 Tax=candidate division MSBL1 archaeon SCGC-AAA259E17 TaxID=1698263 RepID=A0A133UCW1_9EURY|nr:hypothetical protein AKJ64_04235 [candidate division MSBL1 archaeon SCGC-AAA259E17]